MPGPQSASTSGKNQATPALPLDCSTVGAAALMAKLPPTPIAVPPVLVQTRPLGWPVFDGLCVWLADPVDEADCDGVRDGD